MAIIAIPKKITKGEDLVVIPKKDYEALLNKTMLDINLNKALKEVAQGTVFGPYHSAKQLKKALEA